MSESMVSVTEGSGKNLHTVDRTIATVLVQEQAMFPAEYPYPTYSVAANSINITTVDSHLVALMAGASRHVRIRRIRIEQQANATTAAYSNIRLQRLTTAGTGGASVTPARFNLSDPAAGATCQTLPSSKGTESDTLLTGVLAFRQAFSTSGTQYDDTWEWTQLPGQQPLIIPAGTSNGIALRNYSAIAGATVTMSIEFVETDYL